MTLEPEPTRTLTVVCGHDDEPRWQFIRQGRNYRIEMHLCRPCADIAADVGVLMSLGVEDAWTVAVTGEDSI